VDAVVRRAQALQETPDADVSALCLNRADAAGLGLADGDRAAVSVKNATTQMQVIVSDAVAEGAALLSVAIEATLPLGGPHGTLTVSRVQDR
jgi:NADH-quinone oxidoreductase subunit G